jgi:hypothetical protein
MNSANVANCDAKKYRVVCLVSERQRENQKEQADRDGNDDDDLDEAMQVAREWGRHRRRVDDEPRNAPDHGAIAGVDHNADRGAFADLGREECEILRLERIVARELDRATLRLRLAGERRIVDLEVRRCDNANVGWHGVAEFDLHNVADNEVANVHNALSRMAFRVTMTITEQRKRIIKYHLSIAHNYRLFRCKFLELFHCLQLQLTRQHIPQQRQQEVLTSIQNLVRCGILVVRETGGDDIDDNQHDAEVKVFSADRV